MHTNCSLGVFMAVLLCVLTCVPLCLFCAEFFLRFLGWLVLLHKFSHGFLHFMHSKNMKAKGLYHVFCIKYMVEAILLPIFYISLPTTILSPKLCRGFFLQTACRV